MQAAHMTFEEEAIKSRSLIRSLTRKNNSLEKSNKALTKRVIQLEKENHDLRLENKLLREKQLLLTEKQQQMEKQLESLNLIIEELRRMVFGKKIKKKDRREDQDNDSGNSAGNSSQAGKRKKANRDASSYRRAKPKNEEITDTFEHSLASCPDCGTLLLHLKTIVRYIEDITDVTKLQKLLKKVEKHLIGSGYCPKCKKRKTAKNITPQVVALGENIKKFIVYLNIIMRLSFEQIRAFLQDTANLSISDGEITACLDEEAAKLLPEKTRLFAKIRGAPGRHYDETAWKVQKGGEGNYCWITRPTIGEDTIFLMGRSRGKENAKELRGEVDNQTGISDDYAAYDNLFKRHQLCMSHPKRKLRDLAESKTLTGTIKTACTKSYDAFTGLYKDLEKTLKTPYIQKIWLKKREEYIKRLLKIAIITRNDPKKLKTIKQTLSEKAENYFTCLTEPGIPADNNKAERGLRHIVLKRKISYGSKSQKGADTMSILCSTLLSCWWNKPKNFFVAYNQMLAA